ncbi:MAG TPA: ribosome maturation factor RimM [Bacteroidota bacterium]
MTDFVAVGKISGPVGIKGEVKIVPWSESTERFSSLKSVWIGSDPKNPREVVVEAVHDRGRQIVMKFGGIDNRTAAEELREKLVLVPDREVVPPREGSFFIDDVLGMNVVTEDGKSVGVVREILRLPSNDLWQIESGARTISIPAVKEFIRSVDLGTRTVVIHEIEGLLDL